MLLQARPRLDAGTHRGWIQVRPQGLLMDRWKEFRRLVVRRGLSPRLKRTGVHDWGAPVEEVGGGGHRRKRDRLGEDAIGGAVAAQSKVQLGP